MPTIDDMIPDPDFREHHALRIAAPPAAVWDALHEVRLGDMALSRALMGIRMLPARLAGRRSRMVSGRFLEDGPVPVLATDPGRSVLAGGAMQPWKLTGGDRPPVLDGQGLRAFAEPGWVRTAVAFVLEADGEGTLLATETRVSATDPETRARFGAYWLLIRCGSGLIRRDLLHAIARRAAPSSRGT